MDEMIFVFLINIIISNLLKQQKRKCIQTILARLIYFLNMPTVDSLPVNNFSLSQMKNYVPRQIIYSVS